MSGRRPTSLRLIQPKPKRSTPALRLHHPGPSRWRSGYWRAAWSSVRACPEAVKRLDEDATRAPRAGTMKTADHHPKTDLASESRLLGDVIDVGADQATADGSAQKLGQSQEMPTSAMRAVHQPGSETTYLRS